MLESDSRSLPALTLPFALFGAMAGFFAVLALAPVDDGSRYLSPWAAAACSGVSGGVLGAVLRRYRALRNPLLARENVYIRLGALLFVAGGAAGALTTPLSMQVTRQRLGQSSLEVSALLGALVGLILLPACAAVYGSALRASRARAGSVVSRADRQRIHFTLFGTMSFFALSAVPAILLDATSRFLAAGTQLALTTLAPVGCVAAILVTEFLTRRSARRCEELAYRREQCAPAEARDAQSPKVSDLGLGNEEWSELRFGHAYRGARVASVVLRGSIDQARHALREIRATGRSSMLVALGMSALIGLSSTLCPKLNRREVFLNADMNPPAFVATQSVPWMGPTPRQSELRAMSRNGDASSAISPRPSVSQTPSAALFGKPIAARRRAPQLARPLDYRDIELLESGRAEPLATHSRLR